jgi:hypothetical protein
MIYSNTRVIFYKKNVRLYHKRTKYTLSKTYDYHTYNDDSSCIDTVVY